MIKINQNISLKPYSTFYLEAKARFFTQLTNDDQIDEILEFIKQKNLPVHILGEGSNTLFTKDYPGLISKISTKGKQIIKDTTDFVLVTFQAGESWPDIVTWAVNNGFSGIENLALIPGTIGAAPVQNIAAYGQSLSDTFYSLAAVNLETHQPQVFTKKDCHFSYRQSIFKQELANKYLITSVTLKFLKQASLETNYYSIGGRNDSLEIELEKNATKPYTIKNVYSAVVAIRSRKLIDWTQHPTVGSFFINPEVSQQKYQQLAAQIPNLQAYPAHDLKYSRNHQPSERVKIPVGRLLEELGWRGKQLGNCMVYQHNAAILTHNGKASGAEVLDFVTKIRQDVKTKYNISLETEVNIL